MEIGEILKTWRRTLGLSQTEMAAGIVSESFYSKVERGVHSIDAMSLFKIMKAHNLSVQTLFEFMTSDEGDKQPSFSDQVISNRDLDYKITEALNNRDVKALRKIQEDMEKDNAQDWYKLFVKRIITMITHDNSEFTSEEKLTLKKKMLKTEDWNIVTAYDSIKINMWVLEFKEIYPIVNTAYRRFETLAQPTVTVEEAAISMADAFLSRCQEEAVDKKYTKSSIEFLRNRRNLSSSIYGFLCGAYYEAYFNGNMEKADKIKEVVQMANNFAAGKA